jgi:hypothetical protein
VAEDDKKSRDNEGSKLTIKLPSMSMPKVNPWIVSTVILLLFSIVLYVKPQMFGLGGATGAAAAVGGDYITAEEAGQTAVDYINNNLVQGGGAQATFVGAEDFSESMYKATTEFQGNNIDVYITKDGKWLFVAAPFDTTVTVPTTQPTETTQPPAPEVVKTDRPEVHAFVMSHCPYGLQFIKAYVPVIELLGDKADMDLNFVNYAMHGEKEVYEQLRMRCIDTEQNDKYTDYLRCFVEAGDSEGCMEEVNIDVDALQTCMDTTDAEYGIADILAAGQEAWGSSYPPFPIDDALNRQYGVRGSPTFVLNGQVVSVNRAAESIKDAICNAFNTPPEECDTELNSAAEAPSFGPMGSATTGTGATASCG